MHQSPLVIAGALALAGCTPPQTPPPPPPPPTHPPIRLAEPVVVPRPPAINPLAPAPHEPPRLHTSLLVDSVALTKMERVAMEIVSPTGETTFHCSAQVKGIGVAFPDKWACGEAAEWVRGVGIYTLRIHMSSRQKSLLPDIERALRVEGDEIAFDAMLWIGTSRDATQDPFVISVKLDRIHLPTPSVTLKRAWTPAADGSPAYVIHNASRDTLYGSAMWGNLFGHVDAASTALPKKVDRGGLCATVAFGEPIVSGGEGTSTEGYFIGEAQRFAPGRYRYVVRVGLAESPVGVPSELVEKGVTTYQDRELIELADEFTIP